MLCGIVAWSIYSQFIRHAYDPEHLVYLSLSEAYMFSPYMIEFFTGSLLATWLRRNPAGKSWAWLLLGIILFLTGGWINMHWN